METYRKERCTEHLSGELTQISDLYFLLHCRFPPLLHFLSVQLFLFRGGGVYFGRCLRTEVPTLLTWAAVRCQVAVAVAIAGGAAVDAAVVVVGAGVGPRVSQPGLSGRFPDV